MQNKDLNSKLNNKDFTIIARDCVGGILYNQFRLRFLSPTINLFFTPEDFNYFCLNLKDYIDAKLEEYIDSNLAYPVGLLSPDNLKPIKVYFMHYDNYKVAEEKWNDRKKRINFDNIFVISTFCYPLETKTLSKELIDNWNKIKYKKVLLVDKNYGFDNEVIIKKSPECNDYAWLLYSPDKNNLKRRTFNDYDFIKFFNEK